MRGGGGGGVLMLSVNKTLVLMHFLILLGDWVGLKNYF